jgi:hypothetical protein
MNNAPPASARLSHSESTSWFHRLRRLTVRSSAPDAADGAQAAAEAAATGVVNLQVWMDQAIWRPAGLWSFAAGLLACGALRQAQDVNWQALALLALLVDALWGGIWRLSGGRGSLLALPPGAGAAAPRLALPYMQEGSPAARLLSGDHTDIWPSALRIGAPAVLLALCVAALLGPYALGLTVLVVVLAAARWTLRRSFGLHAPLLQGIVAVGLPWVLTVEQAQRGTVAWAPQLLLAAFWVLHQWGGLRNSSAQDSIGLGMMAAAQIGICSLLIAVQSPLWLAPLALLLLPNWLLAWQGQPLRKLRFLWLAAMLVSAAALGQTAGG